MQRKEPEKLQKVEEFGPVWWVETSENISRHFQFDPDGQFSVSLSLFSLYPGFAFVIVVCQFAGKQKLGVFQMKIASIILYVH